MSPIIARNRNDFPGFPRVSGDEPIEYLGNGVKLVFSPRERG